ncbi:uncharacterized protein BDZ99DRAFT_479603 [Mytilinidion resinicola]|uniref:Uncharacterized protein n=1 Tax=Mytilinidion resinicola TaxID=574789 RepID=A0A6A6YCL2_9PEZI|nr:uncharacterized protein BDZ99DRAFT_479603 [Mytilinidion resinicola]KAF2806339.1 hypothetical protein BDZ99DRAFT_479603 [Mytilinidion resinicola]
MIPSSRASPILNPWQGNKIGIFFSSAHYQPIGQRRHAISDRAYTELLSVLWPTNNGETFTENFVSDPWNSLQNPQIDLFNWPFQVNNHIEGLSTASNSGNTVNNAVLDQGFDVFGNGPLFQNTILFDGSANPSPSNAAPHLIPAPIQTAYVTPPLTQREPKACIRCWKLKKAV